MYYIQETNYVKQIVDKVHFGHREGEFEYGLFVTTILPKGDIWTGLMAYPPIPIYSII